MTINNKHRNGHSDPGQVPGLTIPEAGPMEADDSGPDHDDLVPDIDNIYLRPQRQTRRTPEVASDRPTIEEQISSMEAEFGRLAGWQHDRVFLLSNTNGIRQDAQKRLVMEIIASACLVEFNPGEDDIQYAGPRREDFSHFPPAVWAPSEPFRFSDTHEALNSARQVADGDYESMFSGFDPDQIPLSSRRVAATFITGNPRPGQAFLSDLERSLPIQSIVIAHWLPTCQHAWAVFCLPTTQFEIQSAGLKFDTKPFSASPKRGR